MPVKIGSFKGKATITLNPDSKWPFSFGMEKAKLILENMEAIRLFVGTQSAKFTVKPPVDPMGFDRTVEDAYADQCGLRGGGQ